MNNELDLNEVFRLINAFIKKTNETNLFNAIDISYKYIFEREKLNISDPNRNNFSKPLVSLLVVSYNSGDELYELFESINNQTYKNIELILVENGEKNSKHYLENLQCPAKYVSSKNIGFAAANNLAFNNSNGSYFCLINPDTILKEDVIDQLLKGLLKDQSVVVTVPKIVFFKPFIDFEISSKENFHLNLNALEDTLIYKKYFIRYGTKLQKNNVRKILSLKNKIIISLPIDQSKPLLQVNKLFADQTFSFKFEGLTISDEEIYELEDSSSYLKIKCNFDQEKIWWARDIINNAGSDIKNNQPYDRGFGEYDLCQYDYPRYVKALCGCVAMISPKVLASRKIFIDEFFAYFEDSELSHWIKNNNLRIKYVPNAYVKHKHSASTTEGSILWNTFVSRSHKIYNAFINNKNISPNFEKNLYFDIPTELGKTLKRYNLNLSQNSYKSLYKKKRPSAAIFNKYWNTMGGGEKHALAIAKILSETHEIYLLGEEDFDENYLKKYFSMNFKSRKYISKCIDSKTTLYFDVFINSTFCSNLISLCPKSFYLVSFPHKNINKRFLKSYKFFHNSNFTKKWAFKYWGNHENKILYPVTDIKSFEKEKLENEKSIKKSNKNFISIGRFTKNGHKKNQHFILKTFERFLETTKENYNLFLIGSLDYSSHEDLLYFRGLEKTKSRNIHLLPNLDYKKLIEYLSISKFYIHATGIDINHNLNPHKLEHFGITIIEALIYEIYPIVYEKGGPAETLSLLNVGETFQDSDHLLEILKRISNDFCEKKYEIKKNVINKFLETNIDSIKYLNDNISIL